MQIYILLLFYNLGFKGLKFPLKTILLCLYMTCCVAVALLLLAPRGNDFTLWIRQSVINDKDGKRPSFTYTYKCCCLQTVITNKTLLVIFIFFLHDIILRLHHPTCTVQMVVYYESIYLFKLWTFYLKSIHLFLDDTTRKKLREFPETVRTPCF